MKESIKLKMRKPLKENEIELVRRTKENYTHEVLEDHAIQEITLWKISQKKIIRYYICNILSFGITYFISIYNPIYYIKFCCIPSMIKEVDYFLVKDIYNSYRLCPKQTKRLMQSTSGLSDDLSLEYVLNNNSMNNQILGFSYNYKFYEYNETINKIIPNFFNLAVLSNKRIYQLFIEGHTSLNRVKIFNERFGKNICKFDYKLLNYYFWKAEFFLILLGEVLAGIEMYCGSRAYFIVLTIFNIIILICQYIFNLNFSLEGEETLDGAKKQIKVKRRYMSQENKDYCYINYIDLLPGDLIYLTKDDDVPCDGVILEGECIIGNSMVNGNIHEINKKALDNNSYNFNYKQNNPSIIFHGSRLIKTFSKLENNSILVLALNTGSNTYKANQFANIRYLFKRNKSYIEIYSKFCGKKNTLFFHGLGTFIIGSIVSVIIFFLKYNNGFNIRIIDLILNILARSFFPSFHVVCSGIIFIGTLYLSHEHIKCYDKSRLLYAGGVNTIFFDKTGTLSEKYLEIGGFFPVTLSPNSSEFTMKYYNLNQIKDLNNNLIDFYTEYQKEEASLKDNINLEDIYTISKIQEKLREKRINSFPKKLMVLFMECMLSCNTLDKKNNQIAGNAIEKEIFTHVKWEMKVNNIKDESKDNFNNKIKKTEENDDDNFDTNNIDLNRIDSKQDIIYDDDGKIKICNDIIQIYPNSYYKITEGKILDNKKRNENEIYNENNNNQIIFKEVDEESSKDDITRDISDDPSKDKIPKQNMYKKKEKVYFLRIFRRFVKTGTLYSSALVYNTITDSINFFIKGPPEEILPFCNPSFIPKDICRVINFYRKNGFINLVMAGKALDYAKEDEQLQSEEYYKYDLTFYGLIILKNKLKKDVKPVIEQLKKLNCDLILNTGDNIYNSLAVGYESGIVTEKKIFHIDYNKLKNKLTISTFNELTKNEKLKIDKVSVKNSDKISNIKNKIQNFQQISSRKISDIIAKKLFKNLNRKNSDDSEAKGSKKRKEMNEILTNNNSTKINTSLFKSQKFQFKEKNNLKTLPSMLNIIKENNREIKSQKHKTEQNSEQNSNNGLNSFNQSINSKNELIDKNMKTSIINDDKDQNMKSAEGKESMNNNNINSTPQAIRRTDSYKRRANKIRTSAIFNNFDGKVLMPNYSEKKLFKFVGLQNKYDISKITKFNPLGQPNSFNFTKENSFFSNNQINNDYYPSKLKDMRNECMYCVSGRALRYIFENRHNHELRKLELPILLNHIKKFGKIFYEMHSKDKSLLVDIYRKMPNKITCMVGDGQNDYDAMMSAHVGINLNKPANKNTVLCHFHPTDGSLFCIAKIIRYGRVIYENIYLLGVSSLLCALNIVITMIILYYYDIKFVDSELDFMSCNYFILSIIAFTVKPDIYIESNLLFHEPTLLKHFFVIISTMNLVFNAGFTTLFIYYYSKNKSIEEKTENDIYGTYIYFMCYFQLLGMIYSINSVTFYRISHRSNYIYWIIMIFLIFFVTFIFCIYGYSIHPILYNILAFEYNPKNVDTFDDKNKLISFCIFVGNVFSYFSFTEIILCLYNKKAESAHKARNQLFINNKKKD